MSKCNMCVEMYLLCSPSPPREPILLATYLVSAKELAALLAIYILYLARVFYLVTT